jgi:hypothetical protein
MVKKRVRTGGWEQDDNDGKVMLRTGGSGRECEAERVRTSE